MAPYFFLGRELLPIDLKVNTHILINLKTIKKVIKIFSIGVTCCAEVVIYQYFQEVI